MVPQGLTLATCSQLGLNPRPASRRHSVYVRGSDKTATDTTTLKGKYTASLTFSTPNCIYADYGKLGKPSLQFLGYQNSIAPSRTPNSVGARPCRHCGSGKHWDNECHHSRKGERLARVHCVQLEDNDIRGLQ